MLVHGFLHLQGFDHQTDEDAATMEKLEVQVLSDLNIDNPYKIKDE
jgi:probable rRNA maturation factor